MNGKRSTFSSAGLFIFGRGGVTGSTHDPDGLLRDASSDGKVIDVMESLQVDDGIAELQPLVSWMEGQLQEIAAECANDADSVGSKHQVPDTESRRQSGPSSPPPSSK